ncbi:BTAD domain-containing putative transcriptional regulator [Salinactinospora qingdaonensis]|uniref:BTAD domain-containing putative transcriptional regulator n=1 Tax=Salinactinospora qingdaonensis TaxID=702744 RepID=A0ABP7EWE3_9ACTN
MFEFRVLGALEITRDGVRVPVPSRRQRALLVRLLVGDGRVVPADDLITAVWEDDPPRRAQHALHTQVSRLRSLLAPACELVVTQPPGYALPVAPETVDARRFEAAIERARALLAETPTAAAETFNAALTLWRGPAYAEFAESFAQAAAVRLEELRRAAREERCEALLAAGEPERAVSELGAVVAAHPLRERPHGQLMRALSLTGRQSEALRVYRDFQQRQRDELGVDPSPALGRLHEQVLRHEIERSAAAPPRGDVSEQEPGATTAIPTPLTGFVGRAAELHTLGELIEENRIVTLVGPGGIGKTRLAWELALRLSKASRPVWWVDLSPAGEAADVVHRFSRALGLHEPAEGDMAEFLVEALRGVNGVIVVDNCEHVVCAVAGLLERIAQWCPGAVLLATSRERLAVPGERVMAVSSLPTVEHSGEAGRWESAAVALFVDRLHSSGGPDLDSGDMALVAELCRRLDGLPLAIELAAARSRSLGLAAMAERSPLELLGGGRGDEGRHRSVRAVLDWSYDLLSAEERALLRRLTVFNGHFTLDDAERVCADEYLESRRVAVCLAGLVDKSMVAGPERDRYRLLDTVRAYASERLTEQEDTALLDAAHARHFVEMAERAAQELRTPEEPVWVARITERLDEFRIVHRWACANDVDLAVRLSAALAGYAGYRMRFEVQEWAETAAALPGAAQHPLRAAALASAANGAWGRGDFSRAAELARQGLAAAAGGSPVLAAASLLVLGDVALLEGKFVEAAETYGAVAGAAGDDDLVSAAEALGSQAVALSYQGDTTEALPLADAARRVAQELGAPGPIALSLYFSGECRLVDAPERALELLSQSRRLAAEVDAVFITGVATVSSVSLRARAASDPVAALAAYREAVEHWRRIGNRTQQWVTLRNVVPLLVRAGQEETACLLHGALAAAPARLPDDAPEASPLAAAIARARRLLGDAAAEAAQQRGRRAGLDDLVNRVLAAVEAAAAGRVPVDQAGSSR